MSDPSKDVEQRLREALTAKADAMDTEPTSATKEAQFLAELRRPVRHKGSWWLGGGVAAAACAVVAAVMLQSPSTIPNNVSVAASAGHTMTTATAPSPAASPKQQPTELGRSPRMTGLSRPSDQSTQGFRVPGAAVVGPTSVSVAVDGSRLTFRPVLSVVNGQLTVAGELDGPAYVRAPSPSFPYAWSIKTPGGGRIEDAAFDCAGAEATNVRANRTFGSWDLLRAGTVTIEAHVCTGAGSDALLRWSGQVVPLPAG